ncbi:Nucleophosmin [Dissostichus eleginoides]|uniref:Nucleophosmin n=1 Tax=Dissostichus eleginoides TaxID=100907 RepID=A0AAD9EVM5_DISEL|nr:Nucleophosmin [Dissostichus eleginoides]
MIGMDEEQMAPQTFLYGCVLEAGKDMVFNPEEDEFEHQLDLRMACVDADTADELHMVEVEGQDMEGQKIKAVLVSLRPSTLPSVCLGGFTITPPATFRLKAGSGPIHISGQHLVMMEADQDDEDEDESEKEESPVKAKVTPSKQQNGKSPKTTTPAKKQDKSPKAEEQDDGVREEGSQITNVQAKFENFVKNGLNIADTKIISDLWKWRQTVKDTK